MFKGLPAIAVVAGCSAFGAASAVLAAMGLGVPFLLAALAAAAAAGLLVYVVARWALHAPPSAGPTPDDRVRQLEERSSALRHDLRGVLSPALMMADRLLKHDDPAIRRAGQAVVRSIERATVLLSESRREADAAPQNEPAGPAP